MSSKPLYVAVEGPCCAGKTTLVSRLSSSLPGLQVGIVPCYADYVGGGRFLPPEVPTSVAEDAASLRRLLSIDHDRIEAALTRGRVDVLVLDRSVHTLLAHRYGVEQLTGLPCFAPAVNAVTSDASVIYPSTVIYLDVSQSVISRRNEGKFPDGSMLIDPTFNSAFRAYFTDLARHAQPSSTWLDGTQDVSTLVTAVSTQLAQRIRERTT